MATLILTPSSGSITAGGSFSAPSYTATDDSSGAIASPVVTGPVPAVDVNATGSQSLVYTLTTANADVAIDTPATYTLTVTAAGTAGGVDSDGFKAGTNDRYSNDTSGTTYETETAIANDGDPLTVVNDSSAAYFDEGSFDPYEVNRAGVVIP